MMLAGSFLVSCEKDEIPEEEIQTVQQDEKVSKVILKQISSLHFNNKDVEMIDFLLPDGSTEKSLLIEGDIVMSPDQLSSMRPSAITGKQYRTYNLVNPGTVNIIGFTGGGQALTSKQRTALQRAVSNYNALNIGLNFTLTFGTNYGPYDIVVYQNPNGQAGGVAGFPSGGNAYKYVQIFSGMENYSTATNEHVITHEIGHSVGLRHTDWSTRQSCGQSGEAAGNDGAVHIPGTPRGYDSNSIMLACFSANEDGNFGYYDRVALEYLY
ncbi:hypothetical protein GCM10007103_14830 [Salinimicrobium marinum]|uniref:Dual-action HEIGH metallo-peptidase n=2 Tax=Salinimicrobium marinum TaxID=680283 RepID=A0A918SCN0_9FLAO|nr:hypothetical protein GCM10007103_14830 [Salinimicrobium marinum]